MAIRDDEAFGTGVDRPDTPFHGPGASCCCWTCSRAILSLFRRWSILSIYSHPPQSFDSSGDKAVVISAFPLVTGYSFPLLCGWSWRGEVPLSAWPVSLPFQTHEDSVLPWTSPETSAIMPSSCSRFTPFASFSLNIRRNPYRFLPQAIFTSRTSPIILLTWTHTKASVKSPLKHRNSAQRHTWVHSIVVAHDAIKFWAPVLESNLSLGWNCIARERKFTVSFAAITHESIAADRTSGEQSVDRLWRWSTSRQFWRWKIGERCRGSRGWGWLRWQLTGKADKHVLKCASKHPRFGVDTTGDCRERNNGLIRRTTWIVVRRKFAGCCCEPGGTSNPES